MVASDGRHAKRLAGVPTGGQRRASRAMSSAFMTKLDRLTTAVYPHEAIAQERDSENAPKINLSSWACMRPVLVGMSRLATHLILPYVTVMFFAAALVGIFRGASFTIGVILLTYLCLCDGTFGEAFLGYHQLLPPGLHCRRSRRTDAIISMVPALQYPHYKGTPWILGGDMATIYPFLAFKLPKVDYVRRWLSVSGVHTRGAGIPRKDSDSVDEGDDSSHPAHVVDRERTGNNGNIDGKRNANGNGNGNREGTADGRVEHGAGGGPGRERLSYKSVEEAVALDLALPEAGIDPEKPFYLVLHGLNGGSAEAYVLDFAAQALKRECGVCVMVTRGCMGTPVRGSDLFHGARISDVRDTVRTLREALPAETPLCMVGYSMGAIIGANYVAISGDDSGVTCCVSMSGSFDTRTNMTSQHSLRLWQPMLAMSLKENFVSHNVNKLAARGIDLPLVERCRTVLEFDTYMVAPYNGYASVTDYYIDMSAAAENKILGLRTPLLTVSALDDPIMTAAGSPIDIAEDIEGLFILLTRSGGHVGWPTGWLPTRNKWGWMSSTSLDFCEAVIATASLKES